jgi:hypothetical protein
MAIKNKTKEEVRQEQVETQVSKFEQFYEKNKTILWSVLGAIVVIWLAILGYQKYIYQPKCADAQEQTFPAENAFQQGEYELALNGDGNVLGFTEIIDSNGLNHSLVFLHQLIKERLGKPATFVISVDPTILTTKDRNILLGDMSEYSN